MYAMVTIKDKPPIAKKIGPMIRLFFRNLSFSVSGLRKGFTKFPTMVKKKPLTKNAVVKKSRGMR